MNEYRKESFKNAVARLNVKISDFKLKKSRQPIFRKVAQEIWREQGVKPYFFDATLTLVFNCDLSNAETLRYTDCAGELKSYLVTQGVLVDTIIVKSTKTKEPTDDLMISLAWRNE